MLLVTQAEMPCGEVRNVASANNNKLQTQVVIVLIV